MTDEELVRQMQSGDPAGFDALYRRYQQEVYRTACLITGNRADGEDVTQEAFIQCAQSIRSLRDGNSFRPWLMRLMTRSAWRYCRSRRRETPAEQLPDDREAESSLQPLLRNEQQRELMAAVGQLHPKQRTVLILYYWNEMPVREIARATGAREGTVKSRLHAARKTLRGELEKQGIRGTMEVLL